MLDSIPESKDKVLIVPPDITRLNSYAGKITAILYESLTPQSHVDIIPALGTHVPMPDDELKSMFGENIPLECFKKHNWRKDVVKKGTISGELLSEWSEGKVDYPVDVEVNKIVSFEKAYIAYLNSIHTDFIKDLNATPALSDEVTGTLEKAVADFKATGTY